MKKQRSARQRHHQPLHYHHHDNHTYTNVRSSGAGFFEMAVGGLSAVSLAHTIFHRTTSHLLHPTSHRGSTRTTIAIIEEHSGWSHRLFSGQESTEYQYVVPRRRTTGPHTVPNHRDHGHTFFTQSTMFTGLDGYTIVIVQEYYEHHNHHTVNLELPWIHLQYSLEQSHTPA